MSKKKTSLFEVLVYLIVVVATIIGGIILEGRLLSWGWRLFVVPLGVPAIRAWHAIGLRVLVGALTRQSTHGAEISRIEKKVGAELSIEYSKEASAYFGQFIGRELGFLFAVYGLFWLAHSLMGQ